MLSGKGMFYWIVKSLFNNDPNKIDNAQIVEWCQELNLSHIEFKVAEGTWKYNLRPPNWLDNIMPPLVKTLQKAGFEVVGYQYIYGKYPEAEADCALERVHTLGLDGFVINAEQEYRDRADRYTAATRYMNRLVPAVGVPVYLCSYRFPQIHHTFPWDQFLEKSDAHMPQVYWAGAHNPAEQLRVSISQLTAKANLPVIPVGSAYTEHGWTPTIAELDEFYTACVQSKVPAMTWWEIWRARDCGFWPTITTQKWYTEPVDPPQPPPFLTLEERVERLEKEARYQGWFLS